MRRRTLLLTARRRLPPGLNKKRSRFGEPALEGEAKENLHRAAGARCDSPWVSRRQIAENTMKIAADLCVYANDQSCDRRTVAPGKNTRTTRLGPWRRRRAHARRPESLPLQ